MKDNMKNNWLQIFFFLIRNKFIYIMEFSDEEEDPKGVGENIFNIYLLDKK